MKTIGLTGGIACGKSTVADILRDRGVPVLDLDLVAREIVAPGQPALAEIAAAWPSVVSDGALDRKALGAVIVADPDARHRLEAMTHPRIWERMEAWIAERAAEIERPDAVRHHLGRNTAEPDALAQRGLDVIGWQHARGPGIGRVSES